MKTEDRGATHTGAVRLDLHTQNSGDSEAEWLQSTEGFVDDKTQIDLYEECVNNDEKLSESACTTEVQEVISTFMEHVDYIESQGESLSPEDSSHITQMDSSPIGCTYCEKTFRNTHRLKLHLRSHTGERPYDCKLCGKAFTQSTGLKNHLLTHSGEKPHKCSLCPRAFTQKGGLKNHMLTHTGEKPFQCSICNKSFTQGGGLQAHMYSHTGTSRFNCMYCEQPFIYKYALRKHYLTKHPDKESPF